MLPAKGRYSYGRSIEFERKTSVYVNKKCRKDCMHQKERQVHSVMENHFIDKLLLPKLQKVRAVCCAIGATEQTTLFSKLRTLKSEKHFTDKSQREKYRVLISQHTYSSHLFYETAPHQHNINTNLISFYRRLLHHCLGGFSLYFLVL